MQFEKMRFKIGLEPSTLIMSPFILKQPVSGVKLCLKDVLSIKRTVSPSHAERIKKKITFVNSIFVRISQGKCLI